MQELQNEKSNILVKLQGEIQDYDSQISQLLKEKYELKNKVGSLEIDLKRTQETLKQNTEESSQYRERNENEKSLKDEEAKLKQSQCEERIKSLQQLIEKTGKVEENNGQEKIAQDYSNKLAKLKEEYTGNIQAMQNKLLDCNNKREEMLKVLKMCEDKYSESRKEINNLQDEKRTLQAKFDNLNGEIADVKEQNAGLVQKMREAEREENEKYGNLLQENMSLKAKCEEQSILVDNLTASKNLDKVRLTEKENAFNALQADLKAQNNSLKLENEMLQKSMNARTEDHLKEKEQMMSMLKEKEKKIALLEGNEKGFQNQMTNKMQIEEELKEKCRVIHSMEELINEYKVTQDQLKRKLSKLEEDYEQLKNQKEESQTMNLQIQLTAKASEEKGHKLEIELTMVKKKLQEKEEEIVVKDKAMKANQEELENAKKVVKEKEAQLNESLQQQQKRSERLEDIAQKTKETEKEIETMRQRSKIKDEKLQEVSMKLIQKSKQVRDLETKCYQLQEEVNNSGNSMKHKFEENEQIRKELIASKKENEDLKALLATYKQLAEEDQKRSQAVYVADTTDKVDQMFAFYINETKCPVMLKKVGDGQYLFGSKKIFAKIQNDKLVIRVGGGYMMIDEFLSVYTAQELTKMQRADKANVTESVDTSGNSTQKLAGSFIKGIYIIKRCFLGGAFTESEAESETESEKASGRKKSDDRVITKSQTKEIVDKVKGCGFVSKRSRSPTAVFNGTNRTKVLSEKEVHNLKSQKSGVGRGAQLSDGKGVASKTSIEEKPVEIENDCTISTRK